MRSLFVPAVLLVVDLVSGLPQVATKKIGDECNVLVIAT